MTGRRILYTIWLGAALLLHLFTMNLGTWVVLVFSLVIPAALIAMTLRACGRLTVEVKDLPPEAAAALPEVHFVLTNHSRLPLPFVRIEAEDANLLTAQLQKQESIVSLPGRFSQEIAFSFPTKCCGKRQIRAGLFVVRDPFGLLQHKIDVQAAADCLVRPAAGVLPGDIYAALQHTSAETGREQTARTGDPDPALIRDYVPGDPVSRIHWKLSEKTDRTLILDRSAGKAAQVKIILDDREPSRMPETGELAEELSELLETAAAILQEAEQQGTNCRVCKWSGREGMDAVLSEPFYPVYQEDYRETAPGGPETPPETDGAILLSPRRRAGEAG